MILKNYNIKKRFEKFGLRVEINNPYAGGYITRHYGDPLVGIETIQIEINRSIYLNEKSREKNANFEECKKVLSELINQFEKNKLNLLS